jgi:murein DD-endopeptidase MepM/ murein hydrolase activator NlpD
MLALAGQASYRTYTIKQGDTLSSIARRVGVPTGRLADANGLRDPDRIRTGQRLTIPGIRSTARGVGTTVRYVAIARGDTLTSLARRAGLDPRTLAARNGIEGGRVYYGAALRVTPYAWEPSTGLRRPYTVARFRCPVASARFINDWGLARSGNRHHAGTDLFAHRGTAVRAPVMGTAERAPNVLGGRAVTLVTGTGIRLYFAHLERYGRVGHVHPGDVIGYVGDSGGARGGPPHVHVELRPNGEEAVNPYPTLRAACR